MASSVTDRVEAPAVQGPLVSIRGLKTYYPIRGSFGARLVGREAGHVKAVDDVSLDIYPGEVLGLVGESGSGKTTLGRTLLGLVHATEGSIVFDGDEITGMSERDLRVLLVVVGRPAERRLRQHQIAMHDRSAPGAHRLHCSHRIEAVVRRVRAEQRLAIRHVACAPACVSGVQQPRTERAGAATCAEGARAHSLAGHRFALDGRPECSGRGGSDHR